MHALRHFGRLIFKSVSVAGAIIIVGLLAWYKPRFINWGIDANLDLIKASVRQLPNWWGDVAEAGLRVINAERTFFFMEIVVGVKLALLGVGMLFRRRSRASAAKAPAAQTARRTA